MKLTGAEILIHELVRQGVDEVFGYPGGSVLDIYDELYKHSDKIKHYTPSHEQGGCHAADGYARTTGKTGVVIATSGPGATNLVTGIAAAYLDSVPLVAITGNVAKENIGRDSFQEVNIVGVTMPITKHNFLVSDVKDLARILAEAFCIASCGRPGPVLVDIPKNVQRAVAEYKPTGEPCHDCNKKIFTMGSNYEKAVDFIKSAKKPCIYVGGGAKRAKAGEELTRFAKGIGAPIVSSLMGLGVIQNDSPLYVGLAGMHGKYAATKTMADCDLLINVGARFSDRATGDRNTFADSFKVIHLDIDRAEINKNIMADAYIVGDIKGILGELNTRLGIDGAKKSAEKAGDKSAKTADWLKYVEGLKTLPENKLVFDNGEYNPGYIIKKVGKVFGADVSVATDVGQHQMWTAQYYDFERPESFVTSGGLGAMGFGLGAAIGAAVGTKKPAVLFTSDGSFHMNATELATAVSYNLPVCIVLLDNNALGMVKQWQTIFYEKNYSQTILNRKTNYVALANAFGVEAVKVQNAEEFDKAIAVAHDYVRQGKGPYLVHCIIDSGVQVLPMIPPGRGIGEIILGNE